MFDDFSFVRRVSMFGTLIMTRFFGELVGQDSFGNRYFRSRQTKPGQRQKRWVLYVAEPEATTVPPEWYGWLHYMCDQPLPNNPENRYVWQKPHQPNLSGTVYAPLPAGHPALVEQQGLRTQAEAVVQSWRP